MEQALSNVTEVAVNLTTAITNMTMGNDTQPLTPEEKRRLELAQLQDVWKKEHTGHEGMHQEMVLIILGVSFVAQLVLAWWKRTRLNSYKKYTLVAMWLVPFIYCVASGYHQFPLVWLLFSASTGYITHMATRKPLDPKAPRFVYRYFLIMFKVCYAVGMCGYLILFSFFMGLSQAMIQNMEGRKYFVELALSMLCYGLYFGCVLRDFAEISAESMASTIGYYTPEGMPKRHLDPVTCAVCGEDMFEGPNKEREFSMPCMHRAHEHCLQGWYIVGKKDVCPYCKEKVDFSKLPRTPWQRQDAAFTVLLDMLRMLVAWQPLILLVIRGLIAGLHLH
eukprot:comp31110_c0_seq1/m.47248 comp31110_c0_seq1/g.47248  ORF comp31110_c0_seq1/g.47248 comp31110_c0_seq1/m.47248 type:complete len:335 (-) comp31110_c0_seq1:162-1166(-)